mmetsp:Transcript_12308/g.17073  ORF Transcript_12308/g.17073 Transcript_12308/m.17073 type:complete len:88 (-) Transcript_12308:89-352(-)
MILAAQRRSHFKAELEVWHKRREWQCGIDGASCGAISAYTQHAARTGNTSPKMHCHRGFFGIKSMLNHFGVIMCIFSMTSRCLKNVF